MSTISLCMIVRDEEDVLGRCLASIQGIADEIVIVDTGSKDRTKEIAAQYTDLIYDFPWIDDFAAARNFAFSKGTQDYLMWLDADDVILEEDREKLLRIKGELPGGIDLVMMKYNVSFDEYGNPALSYYRERLFRREKGYVWEGAVHEAITPAGTIVYRDAAVTHRKLRPSDPDRNLRIFEKLLAEGRSLDPRQQFYYGRELLYHNRLLEAVRVFTEFLDSGKGWVENCIDCCRDLALCYEKLGREDMALQSLFRSFQYEEPRAEICCEIGRHFLKAERPKTAAFWYGLALTREKHELGGGFQLNDCYDYIPYIQLCVCYDKLGRHALAEEYNEMAGGVKPLDAAYLHNKTYFENLKSAAEQA